MPEPGAGTSPDPQILRQKIQFMRDTVRMLRQVREQGEETFRSDWMPQAAATRSLQIGIEAMLDAANHVIAREGLGLPKTYGEAIEILVRERILPAEHREVLLRMVRFRNRAVHLYDEIDPGEIWTILEDHLGDFEIFIEAIVQRYL